MRWACSVTMGDAFEGVIERGADALSTALEGVAPDLVLAFLSAAYAPHYGEVPQRLRRAFPYSVLLGCSVSEVIGPGAKRGGAGGIALGAAILPGVQVTPFHLEAEDFPETAGQWRRRTEVASEDDPAFLLLADPASSRIESLLPRIDAVFPGTPKSGALAGTGERIDPTVLFLGEEVYASGLVGVALSGDIEMATLVVQEARPIGEPMFVSACRGNTLIELDRKPVGRVLEALYEALSVAEQASFPEALLLGVAMARQEIYGGGDFLLRAVTAAAEADGGIEVAHPIEQNQVVQFHLRDSGYAIREFERRCSAPLPAVGALLFASRHSSLPFEGLRVRRDPAPFPPSTASLSLCGFFSDGTIATRRGRTHLHRYTNTFTLFRARGR
ncbi:MAG: hypothetical protein D6812_01415 [Deltaproteobacteria bacterium]|nr:MAG: hypothetical protein D6812_01415 [Deltaproteobacteria bacterium]